MATQDGKLRAFTINQKLSLTQNIDLFDAFKTKFLATLSKNRLLKLSNVQDDPENDLINFAIFENQTVFCSLMRLELDTNAKNVPDELFYENSFDFAVLQTAESKTNIYKKHFYFCFNNKFLATTLPGNLTIKGFQTYINWFLGTQSCPYIFNPLVRSNNEANLANVKNIIFTDKENPVPPQTGSVTFSSKVFSLGMEILKKIINDVNPISEAELSQIISARLLLDFKRPRNMSEEEYQQRYGAIFKPIADTENIEYVLKNGQRIKADKMLVAKPYSVDLTEKGNVEEEQLRQAMLDFLDELAPND